MKNFYVYNSVTGEIMRTGSCPADVLDLQAVAPGVVVEGVADPSQQYYENGLQSRTGMGCSINTVIIMADGIEEVVISNLPNPTVVNVEGGGEETVADGVFEFTTEVSGEYKIICQSLKHFLQEYVINAY